MGKSTIITLCEWMHLLSKRESYIHPQTELKVMEKVIFNGKKILRVDLIL